MSEPTSTRPITVEIDGARHGFPPGWTVLQAMRSLGIEVPTFCHDDRLAPVGQCWSCAVEIRFGAAHVFRNRPACRELLVEGCEIRTGSAALDAFRRQLLEELAARVAPDELRRFPDKALHRALLRFGIRAGGPPKDPGHVDASHPHIRVDMDRCIACRRCVRICDDLQGESVWHVFGRGDTLRVDTEGGVPLAESPCVGCGACVDTCPTAALTDATAWRTPPATTWTRTICPYCGVGCELDVGVADDHIVAARPVLDAPVNKGHLCVKGRYAWAYADAADRATAPLLREGDAWQPVDWDAAIAHVAEGLRKIVERHGPDAVGILGSARATNEENYLTQKFARLAIGTNNVDCCARVCHAPSAAALKHMLGTGASTNTFDDIEAAQCFLVAGANPLENHPVVGARIRQQVLHGAQLVVIDPRRTPLAAIAHVHLAPRPGTNIPLLNAIAHVIVVEGLVDRAFVDARVSGFDAFATFVLDWPPERAASLCGVAADDIRRAARMYASVRPAMCLHGLGMTEHRQGTQGVMALIDLALITGNIGTAGTGVNPLRGQNNVQGAAVMGCEPGALTGSARIADAHARFGEAWGTPLPLRKGLNALQMIDAARDGRLKGMYVVGFDILASLADAQATAAALARLDLLVVQDLFLTETARAFGHVFLPAASSFEKDGTFMNSERRIQRVRRLISPRGDAMNDGEIVCRLAAALGHREQFPTAQAEAVWEEVRALWPAARGITYRRIEARGLQWPCRDERDAGSGVLHAGAFAHGDRAKLECIDFTPTPECVDADYPLLLTTGRALHQFNVGTMTGRTAQRRLRETDTLDMSPEDAGRLALDEDADVRVVSRHGETHLPLRITDTVAPGQLFATFHDPARALNALTGPVRDSVTGAPEYKVVAVRVEPT